MTKLAGLTGEFAQMLTSAEGSNAKLTDWITTVRAVDLPHLHSFTNGLELVRAAVDAGLTRPYHYGRTERQHPNQTNHETDARPSRVPPTPPQHPLPAIATRRYGRLRARA